jgi:hypothetical protein
MIMKHMNMHAVFLLLPLCAVAFTQEELEEFEKQSYELVNNDNATRAVYDGALEQLTQVFSDDNLAILDRSELRFLRNMIYAQYGYAFKSQDLLQWFSDFEWYEPLDRDVDDCLTLVDSINIQRIMIFESIYKEKQQLDINETDLIGIWHVSPMVAAGYGELIYFFPDHTFKITANQMDWGNRLSSVSGTWSLQANRLILDVTEKYIITGGDIVEGYASCASEFAIENGTPEHIVMSPSELRTYPISEIIDDDLGGMLGEDVTMPRIRIGTVDFWLFSTDPYTELR